MVYLKYLMFIACFAYVFHLLYLLHLTTYNYTPMYNEMELDFRPNKDFLGINPSIALYNDSLWGLIRITNDHKCPGFALHSLYSSYLMGFSISPFFNVTQWTPCISIPSISLCQHITFSRYGPEDPRAFVFQGARHAMYSIQGITPNPCNGKMVLANLDTCSSKIIHPQIPAESTIQQKNWLPFVYKNQLRFEYKINPHIVIDDQGTVLANTSCSTMLHSIHGGSPSILINRTHRLGLAHTHPEYHNMFYVFTRKYPWRITSFTPPFLFSSKHITQYASGMILNQSTATLSISYTIGDCKSFIISMPISDALLKAHIRCPLSPSLV